jgi:hypothetical protein
VNPDDVVPLGLGHVEDHPVAQDAGHVDEHVEPAELVDRARDEALGRVEVRDVGPVDDRLAARLGDLGHHLLGGAGVVPGAVHLRPEVVDHDRGALAGQQLRHRPADSPAGSGDDRHPPVQSRHAASPDPFRNPRLPLAQPTR